MPEYRTHSFNKEWHEKMEKFIEENDLAFDSPKYFIKYCVNRFMEQYNSPEEVVPVDNLQDALDLVNDRSEE